MPPVPDTSPSRSRISARWPTSPRAAVIVAESLRRLRCAVPPALTPGPVAAGRCVAAAIAQAVAPPLAPVAPPDFLRPRQHVAFQRILAALERYSGALLAEPVGTGKTYIALAAARLAGNHAIAVVPASLGDQWARAARSIGVSLVIQTHEQWSRAPRPMGDDLVVVDEAHRFRNPATRRYGHLAPALIGRRVLLLTATPIVNRLSDLAHQLLLGVRDDALIGAGVPSLMEALSTGAAPPALADLVIAGTSDPPRPATVARTIPTPPTEERSFRSVIARLDRLGLSRHRPVRELLRCTLLAALSSSRPALVASLERYRLLLLHAQDARLAGQAPGRADLRRLLAGNPEQTVLWELCGGMVAADDLVLEDEARVANLLASLRMEQDGDKKAQRLRALLEDGRRTVVFVNSRATVHHLRQQLGPPSRVAWCTGTAAGIGPGRLRRRAVLDWFRPRREDPAGLGPRVLVTTDVAAEGLDLQGAERIVHYDLPWTGVRLEQRAGRAVRLGSPHQVVELVRFEPPRSIERRIRRAAALLRKAPMPRRIGLGEEPDPSWAWRARTAAAYAGLHSIRGTAIVRGTQPAALAGLELVVGDRVLARFALYRDGNGPWREDPALIEAALLAASTGANLPAPRAERMEASLQSLARVAGLRAARLAGTLYRPASVRRERSAAVARIGELCRHALRQRDPALLALAEHALRFLSRGHTSGEHALVRRIGQEDWTALPDLLARVPEGSIAAGAVAPRLVGIILFDPG
jgi:superfamily II DNA or RNA helicase